MNKAFLSLPMIMAFALCANSAMAQQGCDEKLKSLETKLGYAVKHHNAGEIAGVKEAISEVKANCTVDSLAAEKKEKLASTNKKITEVKIKLEHLQGDLKNAVALGKSDKVAKYTKKIAEQKDKLAELMAKHGQLMSE